MDPIHRRDLLKAGAATVGGATLGGTTLGGLGTSAAAAGVTAVQVVDRPPIVAGRGHYVPNRPPLRQVPFQKLPPGAVTARGWLAQQLALQLDGMNGRYDEISDYLAYNDTGWIDPGRWGWEEMPYWLRGFGDLGYVTGHPRILEKARRWIDGILATRDDDGWFGPDALRTSLEGGPDFWPGMPLLNAFRSWHEFSGDDRVLSLMTGYFGFQNRQPPEVFGRSWGAFRWGDNIDSVYWLYNRTGEAWLLDLVHKMHAGSADYTDGIPTWHNVNLAQGFREPLQYGLLAGDEKFGDATYRDYDTIMSAYGQFPGGGFAGDENARRGYGDPRQGFETCGIVEFMHSFEMLTRLTGDPVWADRAEELAVNSLPAAFDPQQRAIHYITSANSVQLDNMTKTYGQFQNAFAMQAYLPGVHNYRCCPHNYGMGWPYYTEELWLATTDVGLCASMYADCTVRARVGDDGTEVAVDESTAYPFGDTVELRVSTPRPVTFPLYLRVPRWADGATVEVPEQRAPVHVEAGRYVVVERQWRAGDTVRLRLPMRTRVRRWPANHDAVSVDRGPVTFSLRIDERVERIGGTDDWPELEVYPASDWNYGLVLPGPEPGEAIEIVTRRVPPDANPFTHDGTPLELRGQGRRIAGWQADAEHVVGRLQPSPARTTAPIEDVTLIPMGAARLRISSFPTVTSGADGHVWTLPPVPSASHKFGPDSFEALYDGVEPTSSADVSIPRFTWWDRRGSTEWVQLDFREPRTVSQSSVYWFDDTGFGACRVPVSWRLLVPSGDGWREVSNASEYGTALDRYNRVTFDTVTAQVFRVEATLRPDYSGGVLEWTFA